MAGARAQSKRLGPIARPRLDRLSRTQPGTPDRAPDHCPAGQPAASPRGLPGNRPPAMRAMSSGLPPKSRPEAGERPRSRSLPIARRAMYREPGLRPTAGLRVAPRAERASDRARDRHRGRAPQHRERGSRLPDREARSRQTSRPTGRRADTTWSTVEPAVDAALIRGVGSGVRDEDIISSPILGLGLRDGAPGLPVQSRLIGVRMPAGECDTAAAVQRPGRGRALSETGSPARLANIARFAPRAAGPPPRAAGPPAAHRAARRRDADSGRGRL